jgi:hypothetical protein
MPNEYKKLCELYTRDNATDTASWNTARQVLDELVEELRIEFGLPRPLHAIFVRSPNAPDEDLPPYMALEATADRSWVTLLTIVLKAEKPQALHWLGAHFRFRLELKPVVDSFYNIQLWPGADTIRVRLGDSESYRKVSLAISASIEAKLLDSKAQGPERVLKREPGHNFVAYYQTDLNVSETELGRSHIGAVPRVGESVAINDGYYRVVDVVWGGLENASRMWAIVLVTAQPWPK